jgi:hypothetical protein
LTFAVATAVTAARHVYIVNVMGVLDFRLGSLAPVISFPLVGVVHAVDGRGGARQVAARHNALSTRGGERRVKVVVWRRGPGSETVAAASRERGWVQMGVRGRRGERLGRKSYAGGGNWRVG